MALLLCAFRFTSESKAEVLRVLLDRLSVTTVQSTDLFTAGWVDTRTPG